MSCTPTPTATEYATLTTFSPSTSFSQSAANNQAVTTVVQQSCVASGTISGSSVCISSALVTQFDTAGGGGQTIQVPVVVSVPVTETVPTQTLFASCASEAQTSPSSSAQPTSNTQIPTSVLVQSTPSPSTVVEASSTTLADGSVVETAVIVTITFPPTSVYLPTSIVNPTLQNNNDNSQGSGTDVAPIVGGVLGGFVGLILVVASLWWLCRRRRSWDDIFEKEDIQNDDAWEPPVRRERDSRRPGSVVEPGPYQYGLVGHVVPPAAAGESLRSSQHGSVSEHSGTHSRATSFSATPLLQTFRTSRPSTAGSVQTNPGTRSRGAVGSTETEPRSLSMVSVQNGTRPLDNQPPPALLGNWTPNTDDLAVLGPLGRTGSPVPPAEQRVLQIVNDSPPSPTETVGRASLSNVIIHTDGGRIPDADPPAYSR